MPKFDIQCDDLTPAQKQQCLSVAYEIMGAARITVDQVSFAQRWLDNWRKDGGETSPPDMAAQEALAALALAEAGAQGEFEAGRKLRLLVVA